MTSATFTGAFLAAMPFILMALIALGAGIAKVLDAPMLINSNQGLQPYLSGPSTTPPVRHVNLAPSTTFAQGAPLGQITGGNVNAVQTVTFSGSPTGGTFTLSFNYPVGNIKTTTALAQAATAAAVQSALLALTNIPPSSVTVTGSNGGPYTVTFIGALAARPIPLLTGDVTLLTGGTPVVTMATTTAGQSAGTFAPYSSAVIAAPTTGPTVTGAGSGSSFGAGTYYVQYSLVTAGGETTPSISSPVTLTAAQNISVTSITGLASTVTKVRFYVNGNLLAENTPSSGATGTVSITGAAPAVSGTPRNTNTAYTGVNGTGTQNARCLNQFACTTDAAGQVTYANNSGAGGVWGEKYPSTPAYYGGTFLSASCPGMDAKALADLGGHIVSGDLTTGIFAFGV